jgi:hypothetical protein
MLQAGTSSPPAIMLQDHSYVSIGIGNGAKKNAMANGTVGASRAKLPNGLAKDSFNMISLIESDEPLPATSMKVCYAIRPPSDSSLKSSSAQSSIRAYIYASQNASEKPVVAGYVDVLLPPISNSVQRRASDPHGRELTFAAVAFRLRMDERRDLFVSYCVLSQVRAAGDKYFVISE